MYFVLQLNTLHTACDSQDGSCQSAYPKFVHLLESYANGTIYQLFGSLKVELYVFATNIYKGTIYPKRRSA